MKKPVAQEKALDLFLASGGKIKLKEIADKVKVSPLTVGRWKKSGNWTSILKDQASATEVASVPPAKKSKVRASQPLKAQKVEEVSPPVKRSEERRTLRKKALFDEALNLYIESNGTITNTGLAKKVGVSQVTIANWKKMPAWKVIVKPEPARHQMALEEQPIIDASDFLSAGKVLDTDGVMAVLSTVDEALDAQMNQCFQAKANVLLAMELIRRRMD